MTLFDYINSVKDKRIGVIGVGVSNRPLIEALAEAGCNVTACDKASREALGEYADKLDTLGVKLVLGEGYLDKLDFDLIFRTPGMHPFNPALVKAKENGAEITSEMELFFRLCPCKTIAITGSDGKTTTSTLIAEILKAEGYDVYLGGNIGKPLLTEIPNMTEDSFAVLDWGRGVWTYKNTWYWGSASGQVDGVPFGWNIGYGFGDTRAASENVLFYNGKAHKLSQVVFHIPMKDDGTEDYMKPWTFSSDDGRFEMDFVPVLDRKSKTTVAVIESDQHQVFGHFTGKAVLDDGTIIDVKDFFGFAEKVKNKW